MPIVDLFRKYPLRAMVGLGVILYVFSATLWWYAVYQSPQRVFEDMLANNLTTVSVTKDIKHETSGQQLSQQVRLQLGASNTARWLVAATQGETEVKTESIATPEAEYIRYTSITGKTDTATQAFRPALNTWGAQQVDLSGDGLFYQALFDINYAPAPPIGQVPNEARAALLEFMRDENVFSPDYTSVQEVSVNGRAAYRYDVAVRQAPYVRAIQAFEKDFGYDSLSSVSATQYQAQPDDSIVLMVDKLSHQLVKLQYERTGYTVTYSDYGLADAIILPKQTIPIQQLTQKLNEISEGQR